MSTFALPHSLEAESTVLGGVFLHPNSFLNAAAARLLVWDDACAEREGAIIGPDGWAVATVPKTQAAIDWVAIDEAMRGA